MPETSAPFDLPASHAEVGNSARLSVGITSRCRPGAGPWAKTVWAIDGVVVGSKFSDPAGPSPRPLHQEPADTLLLWSGLQVELFPDQGESYYANLLATPPKVFVVCAPAAADAPHGPRPELVTVSYDEAMSHVEVDEDVYSVPMPAEMILWLERYVLANYVPEKRTKRKRVEWTEARPSP